MGTYRQLEHTLGLRLPKGSKLLRKMTLEDASKKILDHLGETKDPSLLGFGKFADVLWLKGNGKRVLKLTTDYNDAFAAQILKDNPSPWLLKVYDVFRPFEDDKVFYCIVAEKLMEPSGSEFSPYHRLFSMLKDRKLPFRKMLKKGLNRKLVYALEDYLIARDKKVEEEGLDRDGWGDFGKDLVYDPLMNRFGEALNTMMKWAKALSHRHIVFFDLHPGNVRFRGRKAILVDLGYGQVPNQQQKIPVL